jgi:CheY-like chemotaxis protein
LYESVADKKKIDLYCNQDKLINVFADQDMIYTVLRNLTSNALKFTRKGTVSLDITHAENGGIKISVSDTGIGISDDKLKSIFEAFQQADGGTSREYGGTGLGLSISRELSTMLGGVLSVTSKIDEGSTFTIILPNMNTMKKTSTPSTLKESEKINDDRERITAVDKVFLIIEDDKNFAHILKERINKENEYALIAFNAKDGLKLAEEYDIKGVLLDLGLPDMNGIDLLKEFKMNLSLRKIPVYVISGEGQEKQTAEYGAIGYSYKPLASTDISNVIEKINAFHEKKVKDLLVCYK